VLDWVHWIVVGCPVAGELTGCGQQVWMRASIYVVNKWKNIHEKRLIILLIIDLDFWMA
jgi:hypothetical protein